MPNEVPIWTLDQVKALPGETTSLVVTPSCRERIHACLPFAPLEAGSDHGQTVVVIGGGALMDEWKFIKPQQELRLICIPSIYGSGAEVSPVVVLNSPEGKRIEVGDEFLPGARVYLPELLDSVSAGQARDACGDVWSHALEAFISPLAEDSLRAEIAELIRSLLAQPLVADATWFALSARACQLQARCSVGLIHGIAHTLEGKLNDSKRFGHAALCATLVWPVLRFNREHSDKWDELVQQFGLEEEGISAVARALHDAERFERVKEFLRDAWKNIVRDRCTRTNGVLVRPGHLEYFLSTDFS